MDGRGAWAESKWIASACADGVVSGQQMLPWSRASGDKFTSTNKRDAQSRLWGSLRIWRLRLLLFASSSQHATFKVRVAGYLSLAYFIVINRRYSRGKETVIVPV